MNSAIELENIRKTYSRSFGRPGQEALKGVSLQVGVGETFGFIGPNGAGKSTAIKILVGVLHPSSGVAKLFGQDVGDAGTRRGLGFVPENPSLQEYLTPYEILLMGLRLHGVTASNEKTHIMAWLERFDLSTVAHSPVRGFSKGMAQRTALAHALSINPRLLILDEPLSGLDPVGRKDVVAILDEYRRAGGTLFFSSHVLHDVEAIADRFGLINKGELITIRSPQELVAEQADMFLLRYQSDHALPDSVSVRSGQYVLEVKQLDMPRVLAELNGRGGKIQEIKPKVSLESIFHQIVAANH